MNSDISQAHGKTKKMVVALAILILLAGLAGWLLGRPSNPAANNNQATAPATSENSESTLDLSGQQLTTLPAAVLNRTDVTTLNLSNNQLTTLPANITNLKNLRTLIIENNRLQSLPEEISQLKSLREIRANNNRMNNLPASIDTMTQLTLLDISGNSIPASRIDELKSRLGSTEVKS